MKKLLILLITSVIAWTGANAQSTYVVNNIPGSAADYHSLQHALDSVPAGSTILLQNTGLTYGSAYIKKPVVIYGAGYFLGQNAAPATQANTTAESLVSYLEFDSASNGSIVSGLHIKDSGRDNLNTRVAFRKTSNITLSRCMVENGVNGHGSSGNFYFLTSSNILITQCYIQPGDAGVLNFDGGGLPCTGITLSNNLITGISTINFVSSLSDYLMPSYCYINNTFYGNLGDGFVIDGCSLFQNNIVIITDTSRKPAAATFFNTGWGGTANHNITNDVNLFSGDAGADNTNLLDSALNIDSVFLHFSNKLVGSTDGIYQLAPNSRAAKFAADGSDIGAYGGETSYALSGIPAIPYAYKISVPQQGAGTISVHIEAKASN